MRLRLDELSNYQLLTEYKKETSMPSVYQIGFGVVFLELLFKFFKVSFWVTICLMFIVVIALMFVENKKFNKREVIEKELMIRMMTQKRETKKSSAGHILQYIKAKKLVSYDNVIDWAMEKFGYTKEYVEDLINILQNEGEIIEPKLGQLKCV